VPPSPGCSVDCVAASLMEGIMAEVAHDFLGARHHRRREMLLLRSHHGCTLRRRHYWSTLLWGGRYLLRHAPPKTREDLAGTRKPPRPRPLETPPRTRERLAVAGTNSVRLRCSHRSLMLGCRNIRRSGGEGLRVRVGHLSSGPASVVCDKRRRRRVGFS
jgi:hypothetical protein